MSYIHKMIDALRQCAEEHENENVCTGQITTSALCRDAADFLEKHNCAPAADLWHYPAKGEDIYDADLDWSITYFLCQMKDGKLAIAFGSCDEGYEGNVSRNIDFCGENFGELDTDDIYAWQYITLPKKEI